MSPVVGRGIGADVCEALGLKNVTDLVLHFPLHGVVTVDVTFYPEEDGVKQLVPILKQYILMEKEP